MFIFKIKLVALVVLNWKSVRGFLVSINLLVLSFIVSVILIIIIGSNVIYRGICSIAWRWWLQNDILWPNNWHYWRHFLSNTLIFGEVMLAMMFTANLTLVNVWLGCVSQFLET